MTHHFKIYGIFRSGTNLLRVLVEQNLDARCSVTAGGHKHLFTPQNWTRNGYVPQDCDLLVCIKDPYAAMLSLFRYAETVRFRHFGCARNWDEFLWTRFIVSVDREPKPLSFRFRDPIDYWNAHYYHMMTVRERPPFFVKYEDMLSDPQTVLDAIAARYGVAPVSGVRAVLPGTRVKRMGERMPDNPLTNARFDVDWYLHRRFMESFDDRQIAVMKAELDPELLAAFGY